MQVTIQKHLLPLAFSVIAGTTQLFGAGNPTPFDDDFYVAPTGTAGASDGNSGTSASPLATIAKAKDLAVLRIAQKTSGSLTGPVNIILKPGRHQLLPPLATPGVLASGPALQFNTADSGTASVPLILTNEGVAGQKATIHGAIEFVAVNGANGAWSQVTNWTVYNGGNSTTSSPAGTKTATQLYKYVFAGTLKADLKARIDQLKSEGVNKGVFAVTDVYFNDDRQVRSRHPNKRAFNADTSRFNDIDLTNLAVSNWDPYVMINRDWADRDLTNSSSVMTDFDWLLDGKTETVFSRIYDHPRALITSLDIGADKAGVNRARLHFDDMENHVVSGVREYPYEKVIAEVQRVTGASGSVAESWNRGWLENNPRFLDSANEWWFDEDDSDGEMALWYVAPTGETTTTLQTKTVSIPLAYTLVNFQGGNGAPVSNIQIQATFNPPAADPRTRTDEGLQFNYSTWKYENGRGNSNFYSFLQGAYGQSGVIQGNCMDNIVVDGCRIERFGSAGISFGGNRMWFGGLQDRNDYFNQVRSHVTNVRIESNYITDGGGLGVRIDNHPNILTGVQPGLDNNRILSNSVNFIGKYFYDSLGIVVMRTINTQITDNAVRDIPYHGISSGWGCYRNGQTTASVPDANRTRITNNGIVRSMQKMYDGGGIYSSGAIRDRIEGNTISSTFTNRSVGGDAIGTVTGGGPSHADIYLDAVSRYYTVTSNASADVLVRRYSGTGTNQDHSITGSGTITVLNEAATYPCPYSDEDSTSDPDDLDCCGD